MSKRRAVVNRIRGPQSALTDFLASNNISAAQISADYERRQREAREQQEHESGLSRLVVVDDENIENGCVETAVHKKKRKKQQEKAPVSITDGKDLKRQKKRDITGTEDEDDEAARAWNMYTKRKPLPGQLDNCEICGKRFTVTPYSKAGPTGGLLCTKCSKEQETEKKKDAKAKKKAGSRDNRRQVQSNLLDGIVQIGALSLQELCIKEVANNIHQVDEFGDLPQPLLDRLSRILSRRRVVTSRTLNLFLRPDLDVVSIYDCGKLEADDFTNIFSIVPSLERLDLRNAGQFRDETLSYIMERDVPIRHLRLDAANLISDLKWIQYFTRSGHRLQSLTLSWLDYAMGEETFLHLVRHCPNLRRLKLKQCFKLGDSALSAMSKLSNIQHLSLQLSQPTSPSKLKDLIASRGSELRTLSLASFHDADDDVLIMIRKSCINLSKLRLTENDLCTDAGFVSLFSAWANPPLLFVDLSSNRSIDYTTPDGPADAIGLASAGFEALMGHSGATLQRLDISSCRHISHKSLFSTFSGEAHYPHLKAINISFLTQVDTPIITGIFRSCPLLSKVTAFGCFNITEPEVPGGIALIGVPHAQDSIVQTSNMCTET